jgi:hypothetical protein
VFSSQFGKFGFILIDGRARKDCLVKLMSLLKTKEWSSFTMQIENITIKPLDAINIKFYLKTIVSVKEDYGSEVKRLT